MVESDMKMGDAGDKAILISVILIAITFAVVLALAATFTDATVSNNMVTAVRNASGLLSAILFVAMAALVLKFTGKL